MAENPSSPVNLGIQIQIDSFFVFILVIGILFSTPILTIAKDTLKSLFTTFTIDTSRPSMHCTAQIIKTLAIFSLLYISLSFLTVNSYNPFIYFRF